MLVCLEMGEDRMTLLSFDHLPAWGIALGIPAHFAAGGVVGIFYFRALWWNARQITDGGRATTTVGLMVGRFALLGVLLTLASLEGALPLLLVALGVLIARSAVMRRVREATP
jgi:F1F0 ATPase subunit 2